MLFDDLDKKIKEAAEQHYPAYDENAWKKMEKLLNQHLPQQKGDRRRVFLFSLLLLLIGGGTFFVISKPWNKPDVSTRDNQSKVQPVIDNTSQNKNTDLTNSQLERLNSSVPGNENSDQRDQPLRTNEDLNHVNAALTKDVRSPSQRVQPGKDVLANETNASSNVGNENRTAPVEQVNVGKDVTTNPTLTAPSLNSPQENRNEKTKNNNVAESETKLNNDQNVRTVDKKNTAQQKSASNRNGLSFFASAGLDVSKAGSSKTGKTTFVYGAGVGYTLNRFTLRTGVFVSKKIYWANPEDYKLSWTPPPSVKFEGADANCDVVEIPVKLSYSFIDKDKSSWFAGAGLSSYIMKKENYVYTYKTPSNTIYYPYETKNENKHYFSILNLSAGYTRRISNSVSLTAEPYVDIPMVGIGVGKVHLTSAGILFSVGVKPFKK